MQEQWLLYALVFLFGYVTCRTFYFLSAIRKSIRIVQLGQLIALFTIVRGIENLQWSRQYRMDAMRESGASKQNIKAFTGRFEDEMSSYKRKSVKGLTTLIGSFFAPTLEFDDWESAMRFLDSNREQVLEFLQKE